MSAGYYGVDATLLGLSGLVGIFPGVASAMLRQPQAEFRNPGWG